MKGINFIKGFYDGKIETKDNITLAEAIKEVEGFPWEEQNLKSEESRENEIPQIVFTSPENYHSEICICSGHKTYYVTISIYKKEHWLWFLSEKVFFIKESITLKETNECISKLFLESKEDFYNWAKQEEKKVRNNHE